MDEFMQKDLLATVVRECKSFNGENAFYEDVLTVVAQLQAELEILKGSCICMDCGEIIKTAEQSEHNLKCKRQDLKEKGNAEVENEKYNKPCPYNPKAMCVQMPCDENDDTLCEGCPNNID